MDPLENIVQLLQPAADWTHAGAIALLTVLAVLAFCFESLRALVVGNTQTLGQFLLRLLLVVAMLGAYPWIIDGLVGAGAEITTFFARQTDWSSYWAELSTQVSSMLDSSHGWLDSMLGMVKGGMLQATVAVSFFLVTVAFTFVRQAAALFFGVFFVLGPLVIVGGVLSTQLIRRWFSSMVHVVLWPAVPPLALFIMMQTTRSTATLDNTAAVIGQNVVLGLLALASPLVVAFAIGGSGMGAAMGVIAMTAGRSLVRATPSAVSTGAKMAIPMPASWQRVLNRPVSEVARPGDLMRWAMSGSGNKSSNPSAAAGMRPGSQTNRAASDAAAQQHSRTSNSPRPVNNRPNP